MSVSMNIPTKKSTKAAQYNEGKIKEIAEELYDFVVEIIEGVELGIIKKNFDNLSEKEMAVFTVRARMIMHKIMGGWI